MINDKAATDDNGHRLTAAEIEMMTDQFNFNAFVAAEIAKVEIGPTHKFDVACRIQEASNHLRINSCKALQAEITALRGLAGEAIEMIDALDDQVGAQCGYCTYTEYRHADDCDKRVLRAKLDHASKGRL